MNYESVLFKENLHTILTLLARLARLIIFRMKQNPDGEWSLYVILLIIMAVIFLFFGPLAQKIISDLPEAKLNTDSRGDTMQTWSLQNAKNRFSSLVEACLHQGPQIVSKRGKETAVLISMEEYIRLTRPQGDLVNFFQNSPLKDVVMDLERSKELPREVDL